MVVLSSNIFALQWIVHLILVISIIKICSHLRDLVVCLGLATLDLSIRVIPWRREKGVDGRDLGRRWDCPHVLHVISSCRGICAELQQKPMVRAKCQIREAAQAAWFLFLVLVDDMNCLSRRCVTDESCLIATATAASP
jgi:hypothetical protein